MDRAGLVSGGWQENVLRQAALAPGERLLVVWDEPLQAEAAELAEAATAAGAKAERAPWSGRRPLAAPPSATLAAASRADVVVFLHHRPLAEEAEARFALMRAVTDRGGRYVYLAFVDSSLLRSELSSPMPDLEPAARRLLDQLEGARELRLRGAAGTDILLRVEGRPWLTDALPARPGQIVNVPGGEVFAAPHRDGAEGVVVVDLTIPYTVPGILADPVTLRFQAGRLVSVEGGEAARRLREIVRRAGPGADVIAEVGIGINPAVRPCGHVMLDEKALGTAHVAVGRNTGPYGGDNEAAIHVDCVFSRPSLVADGRSIALP